MLVLSSSRVASADPLEAPIGGKAIPLPGGAAPCGSVDHGWTVGTDRRSVKPPSAESEIGQSTDVTIAVDPSCATVTGRITLVATGPWPTFDPQSILASPDDGRIEARGTKLRGAIVRWMSPSQNAEATCETPAIEGATERCVWNLGVASGVLSGSGAFTWAPAGSRATGQVELFDGDGRPAAPERFRLSAARTVLSTVIAPEAAIDALGATATIPIRHADAVASVDCAPALCAIEGSNLVVGSLPVGVSSLLVRLRLSPRLVFRRGDALETNPVFRVPVLRCPLAVISGSPLRDLDNQKVVLKVEGRCATEAQRLRFQVAGYAADRIQQVEAAGILFVVLRLPQLDDDEVTLTATRDDGDAFVVAQTRVKTRAVPPVRVSLEIPKLGPVDFLPTNVDAVAHVSSPSWDGRLFVAPVDGLYSARVEGGRTLVRGAADELGFVNLRVALRSSSLPAPLSDTDLAVVSDSSQRSVHEANVPASLETPGAPPLVELLCDPGDGTAARIPPGVVTHIPFERKDSCRLVLHAERLEKSFGTQKLALEVDVVRVDGTPRVEARISRTLTFAPGSRARILWLHGADNRFDRFSIRLSHAADDRHYVGATDSEIGLPAEQWTVITGRGSARIYATSAIPTGLYRVSDRAHSGILTLNFGVLARLTWLDALGREGLIAAEGGVMAVGLANDVSASGRSLTQVATVAGVGFSVPIANRALATETAINLHAWYEWEPSRALGGAAGNPSAFVFGPSISIGNIGADL
jgi:hypothetical protein